MKSLIALCVVAVMLIAVQCEAQCQNGQCRRPTPAEKQGTRSVLKRFTIRHGNSTKRAPKPQIIRRNRSSCQNGQCRPRYYQRWYYRRSR